MATEQEKPMTTAPTALTVGARVRALKQITEGGAVGDPEATFPQPGYIHAERGDKGTVETVDHGDPTVRFDITKTATIVGLHEIEPITPANKYLEEMYDKDGPTGQYMDVREIRMDDEGFHADVLDDGIRKTVLWLRANGFRTIDSGDGEKDHPCAHKFPNVFMEVAPDLAFAETDRLIAGLKLYGIEIGGDADDSPIVEMMYMPAKQETLIRMLHVDDELLRKHGVIPKTAKEEPR